jgi:hypothetical protein
MLNLATFSSLFLIISLIMLAATPVNIFSNTAMAQGFNGTNRINGTQGPPDPNQIPPTKIYVQSGAFAITIPQNSSAGFASASVMCNPGDTAISGQYVIEALDRTSFPGSGARPESLSGSYLSGILSLSNPPTNNMWTFKITGNNLGISPFVTCFDNPPLRIP